MALCSGGQVRGCAVRMTPLLVQAAEAVMRGGALALASQFLKDTAMPTYTQASAQRI